MEARRTRLRIQRLEMMMGRKPNIGRRYIYFASDTGTLDEANPAVAPNAGLNNMTIKEGDGGSEKRKNAVIKYAEPVVISGAGGGLLYCEEAIHTGTVAVTTPVLARIQMAYIEQLAYGIVIAASYWRVITAPFEITEITWSNQNDYGTAVGSGPISLYQYEELVINAGRRIVMVIQGIW